MDDLAAAMKAQLELLFLPLAGSRRLLPLLIDSRSALLSDAFSQKRSCARLILFTSIGLDTGLSSQAVEHAA